MTAPDNAALTQALECVEIGRRNHGEQGRCAYCAGAVAAAYRSLLAENAALRKASGRLREFNACMEAQRKEVELPPGHDDPDESCGDGTCFQIGRLIEEVFLEDLDRIRSSKP